MANFSENIQLNQQLSASEQAAYLKLVRSGPGVLAFKHVNGKFREIRFKDDAEALSLIAVHGVAADTWVSMATYSDPLAARTQDNAEALCALWLDIDAHKGSKYESVSEVEGALNIFINQTLLPQPTAIHYTGRGVHAIWALSQVIDRRDWQLVAEKLQELAKRMFLNADPITADAARILRVAGTLNFKNPQTPVLAHYKQKVGKLQPFEDLSDAIDAALSKLPIFTKSDVAQGKGVAKRKGFENPETTENIATVGALLNSVDPDLEYDQWRNIVWSVAATNWDSAYDLASAWSAQGKSWDESAFNRVWDSFNSAKPIGFGTLVYHARRAGYSGELPSNTKPKAKEFGNGRLKTVCAADIEPEHVEWLVDQSFPLGMLAVI